MSRVRTAPISFECYHDHSQTESCNGHELIVERCLSSDTVSILVDGEVQYVFDEGLFEAIIQSQSEAK
jgi:hypothetical protein